MVLKNFWVVCNPHSNKSTIGDICGMMNSWKEFMNFLRGTESIYGAKELETGNYTIHTNAASAEEDAKGRLAIFQKMQGDLAFHLKTLESSS